jgi:hypothetical protein
MRRLNASTILLVTLFLNQPAFAKSDEILAAEAAGESVPAQAAAEPVSPAGESLEAQKPPSRLSRNDICEMIESAATDEELPVEFLVRLIWQESKFNPFAVSPAGARGIAQFMPKTASGRGLADPFEPIASLYESAEFLRELRDQFGNLGLAAAAYNAGPKRVQDWLAKRGPLPRETQDYVHIITGHRPEKWTTAALPSVETAEFKNHHCGAIAKLAATRHRMAALERLASAASQRISDKASQARSEAAAKVAARNSARSGVLAKRGTQPASATRIEQVTKLVARPGKPPRAERIIKITAQRPAQSRGNKLVEVVEQRRGTTEAKAGKTAPSTRLANLATAQRPAQSRGNKLVEVVEQRRGTTDVKAGKATPGTRLANLATKTSAVSAQKKTAAAKPAKESASSKVQVAANGRPKGKKS